MSEIDDIKQKIKDLYRFKHVYNYSGILDKIKKSFKNTKKIYLKIFI